MPNFHKCHCSSCYLLYTLSTVTRASLFIILATLSSFHLANAAFDDYPPDTEDITASTLYFQDSTGYRDSPILDSSVQMHISGVVARVTLQQSFNNDSPEWAEGIYVFPLPTNAAVNALTISVGERIIKGHIAEKQQAERKYIQARKDGKITSLVKQNRPNLFTTNIANIAPGEVISIKLEYIQTIEYRDDQFSLRFPTTLTPRYSNAHVKDATSISPPQKTLKQANANNSVPTLSVHATIFSYHAVSNLSSPTHELITNTSNGETRIELPVSVPMDQDFILNWSPPTTTDPQAYSWVESVDDTDYLLTMISPPQNNVAAGDKPTDIARELILVIDTSGSMAGESIDAATRALSSAINGLRSTDRFNVIAFDSYTQKLFPNSVIASSSNLNQAKRFIRSLYADGGTEMSAALEQALANPIDGYLRQAVFITDGSVGNEDALFRQIDRELRGARLFTVGIGSAPNSYFMKKAAQAGRGTYTWVRDISDAENTMAGLFNTLEQPVITDIKVEWTGGGADFAPNPINDLYTGEAVVLTAKLDKTTTGLTLNGQVGTTPWSQHIDLSTLSQVKTGLSTLWARQKIEALIDAQRNSSDNLKYKPQITRIALTHQLLSPYTSFIAIDETPVRSQGTPLRTGKVANLMPKGSEMIPLSIPQGAAGTDTLLVISLLSAMLGFLLWFTALQLNVPMLNSGKITRRGTGE